MAVFSIAVGLIQMRASVRHYIHRQVEVDRESASAAFQIRASLITLSQSYSRMDFYRNITLAACPIVPTPLCPEALIAFRLASKAESAIQLLVRAHWIAQSGLWRSGSGIRNAFPPFNFAIATGTEKDLTRFWSREFNAKTQDPVNLTIRHGNVSVCTQLRRAGDAWTVAWTQ